MEGRSHDDTSPFEEDEHSRLYNRSMALLFTVENISLWRQIIPSDRLLFSFDRKFGFGSILADKGMKVAA